MRPVQAAVSGTRTEETPAHTRRAGIDFPEPAGELDMGTRRKRCQYSRTRAEWGAHGGHATQTLGLEEGFLEEVMGNRVNGCSQVHESTLLYKIWLQSTVVSSWKRLCSGSQVSGSPAGALTRPGSRSVCCGRWAPTAGWVRDGPSKRLAMGSLHRGRVQPHEYTSGLPACHSWVGEAGRG